MNSAYCDESEYHLAPGVYAVSGFLGRAEDWWDLGRTWRKALQEEGLEAVGFHMAACESGSKPPWNQMQRPERQRLQRRFIGLINAAPLWGMATVIEMDRMRKPDILGAMRSELGPYHKPYYQAFQFTVGWMADTLEENRFPMSEVITFTFDEQQEYKGNARELYLEMRESEDIPNRHRLGSLTFANDIETVQLQAADIWAYEVQRHVREYKIGKCPLRWQWELLHEVPSIQRRVKLMDHDAVEGLAREQGWIE